MSAAAQWTSRRARPPRPRAASGAPRETATAPSAASPARSARRARAARSSAPWASASTRRRPRARRSSPSRSCARPGPRLSSSSEAAAQPEQLCQGWLWGTCTMHIWRMHAHLRAFWGDAPFERSPRPFAAAAFVHTPRYPNLSARTASSARRCKAPAGAERAAARSVPAGPALPLLAAARGALPCRSAWPHPAGPCARAVHRAPALQGSSPNSAALGPC
mmetsp:Transcript_51782/g.165752  ORF Transcript_51782/g.165752 Transcript_51782/m.165752 type:complete len:220 (-) Transcript_51782:60-719(-)